MSAAPFLMTTAIGAVNLVLPIYLSNVYHLSPLIIGLFFTASNVFTLFTQIPSGRLADRYDPKKILLICTGIIPIFFALWHFSHNWVVLLVSYSVALGLWSVTWPSNLTTLSTKIPRELQGAGFGINSTGLRLGFTVGPLIGSILYGELFPTAPFLFAALSTLLALPIINLLKSRD
jgi:MFS family permease